MAVLVVAIIALRDPKGSSSTAGSTQTSTRSTVRTTPSTSSSDTRTPSGSSGTPATAPPVTLGRSAGSEASTPSTLSSAAAHAVPLVVLNNTTTSGLAAQAATRFEQGGWTVTDFGNLANVIISTCAYYDPSVTNAKAAAKALQAQYPTIKRVKPRFDGLPSGPIVVVLTADYSTG